MKILSGVIIVGLTAALWVGASSITTYRLNTLVANGDIPYGPVPDVEKDYYSFEGLHSAFNTHLDIRRTEEFSRSELEKMIISSVKTSRQKKLKKYITSTLKFSEDYQMDPFWIIAVMMVESGFDKTAQSPRNARGLMQIKPDTAEHLYQLMNKKNISEKQIERNLHHPDKNIEVGVFYLKKLLQNFRLNYRHATIAYNVGPNKLKSLLNANEIDTAKNSYLVKVQDHYNEISNNFSEALKARPKPFELTYVVKDQGHKLEEQYLGLFASLKTDFKTDFLLSSENLASFSLKTRSF